MKTFNVTQLSKTHFNQKIVKYNCCKNIQMAKLLIEY